MILGKSTQECISLLAQQRERLLKFERRLSEGDQQAILGRLHNIAMDRFDNYPESNINCDCGDKYESHKAFSASPNDNDTILFICVDCGTVQEK